MKKIVFLLLFMSLVIFNCKKKYEQDGIYAEIETDKGVIVASLEFKKAPLTVSNFIGLSEGTIKNAVKPEGTPFYDGLTFFRVEPDFVIQGGDPNENGTGGPGYEFSDEFHPDLKHSSAGILSMANGGPNTNGSQFFITLKENPFLDNKHSVFGQVIEGIDVVKKIEKNDKIKAIKIVRQGMNAREFKTDDKTFKGKIEEINKKIRAEMEAKLVKDKELVEQNWPDAKITDSGLKYIILKEGKGETPTQGTKVKAHYSLKLLNGQKIDSSFDRGQPFEFEVGKGKVIRGWDEAVLSMRKGEKRLLIVPPHLGYGERKVGPMPPNSTLVFEMELIDF